MEQELNKRSEYVLKILAGSECSIAEILEKLHKKNFDITKVTLNRDLNNLISKNLIVKVGQGKATKYNLSEQYKLIRPIDYLDYFQIDADDRKIYEKFNYEIFPSLKNIFSKEEINQLESKNHQYQKNISELSKTLFYKELERLTIELSWKSSKLEGNTYTLLDTERLIKEHIESKDHSHEEAVMILNHKKTLDYIYKHRENYKDITVKKITEIHTLLTKGLNIPPDLRNKKVGILGTKYKPPEKKSEIKKVLESLCKSINLEPCPLTKALVLIAMVSYLQAFEDGNKRTARITANAILLAYNYCPLSYRSVNEFDYKKAILLFYEQNNINLLKSLFIEQFEFSIDTYF